MHWRSVLKRLFGKRGASNWEQYKDDLAAISRIREELRQKSDADVKQRSRGSRNETFAAVAEAIHRTLGVDPFDVQVIGGLALADGKIAEMQTGEGKTLVATMPVVWGALAGEGVHVLTANDYLAERDAAWMGEAYRFLGLTVGFVAQGMPLEDRQRAYACDVTYASATEIGFDFLRDQLRKHPEEIAQRPFQFALVDEVDSILIDEARIPLVIAGGGGATAELVTEADRLVRSLEALTHYETVDTNRRVILTEAGALRAEALLGCGNLYQPFNSAILAAISQAIHAHALLERDVDYLVKDDAIDLVDEFKGRVAADRRWPEGLQAAVEAKEGLRVRHSGRVLGEITMQNLIGLYPFVCGMTGTAATQADEFRRIYSLDVVAIPTNRPVIRIDQPDVVLDTEDEKFRTVVDEIRREHTRKRPVLVGTVSVAASERLGRLLDEAAIPHQILNARNEEAEARIIREAGQPGAVTISTNMAGRGTDIVPSEHALSLGGLYVIGTNRHESRRIDNQLRGRSGRQGDPGESRFFLSLEDEMFRQYGLDPETDIDHAQRVIEGQHLSVRSMLWEYERVVELQRHILHDRRRSELLAEAPDTQRQAILAVIDDWWSRYLEEVTQLKEDVAWQSLSRIPLHEFQRQAAKLFDHVLNSIDEDIRNPDAIATPAIDTGATWTFQTTDHVFPDAMARLAAGLKQHLRKKA